MSDAAITTIVTGVVTIAVLWIRLKYASDRATDEVGQVATKTAEVEGKLDSNTLLTKAVDTKADTIVSQTNGALTETRTLVEGISERVSKLEDYNRNSAHRVLDALNTLTLKVERLLVINEVKPPPKDKV